MSTPSVMLYTRIPPALKEALEAQAKATGQSMQQILIAALEAYLPRK